MAPDLSDRDRERFEALRETLAGVSRTESTSPSLSGPPGPIEPMLATTFEGDLETLDEDQWIAERKFDGTRIVLEKFDGDVSLYTRRAVERSETLSALTERAEADLPDGLVLDGEYTYLTPGGASRFIPIHTSAETVERERLDECFFVFDVLAADGEWWTRRPLLERKERLAETVPDGGILRVTDYETSGLDAYYGDLVAAGEEGIIIKRRDSPYHVGTRSRHWQKVKAFTEADLLAVGFTSGEGRRADTFGALVLSDGGRYVGRVGSGFSEAELETLREEMTPVDDRRVPVEQVGQAYTAVEPFVVQVTYQAITRSGHLRAPVFRRLRPDKPIEEVQPIRRPKD